MIQKLWPRLLVFLAFCAAFVTVTQHLLATMAYDLPIPELVYDGHGQATIRYDNNAKVRFAYDARAVFAMDEKKTGVTKRRDLFIKSAEFLAAEETAETLPQYYIENGVRRSVASQQAGLGQIPATIYQEGQAPVNTTLNLNVTSQIVIVKMAELASQGFCQFAALASYLVA